MAGRDHNATSYSTETSLCPASNPRLFRAEIITLRAIALKQLEAIEPKFGEMAEIITLRAIALKLRTHALVKIVRAQRS